MADQISVTVNAFVKRALIWGGIFAALAVLASIVLGYPRTAFSIAAGAVTSMASFAVLVYVVTRAFGGGRAGIVVFFGIIKMAAIGAALWWLVSQNLVEPLAFMAGFSAMVVSLTIEGIKKA